MHNTINIFQALITKNIQKFLTKLLHTGNNHNRTTTKKHTRRSPSEYRNLLHKIFVKEPHGVRDIGAFKGTAGPLRR